MYRSKLICFPYFELHLIPLLLNMRNTCKDFQTPEKGPNFKFDNKTLENIFEQTQKSF